MSKAVPVTSPVASDVAVAPVSYLWLVPRRQAYRHVAASLTANTGGWSGDLGRCDLMRRRVPSPQHAPTDSRQTR